MQNQSQTIQILNNNEISIYQNGQLTKESFAKDTARILQAFPKMPIEMFNLLKDRFKENNFTDERLKDSVSHVIDTYQGWDKLPNIANFIQFDKKIKIYTNQELLEITKDYSSELRRDYFDLHIKIKWNGELRFVKKENYSERLFQKWES